MKKLSIIAAGLLSLGCLCAEEAKETSTWVSNVSGMTSVKFQSEYANRGRKEMKEMFAPKLKIKYDMFEGAKAYAGVDSALSLEKSEYNQVKPFLGMCYDVTDMFTLDAGYIHHFYTSMSAGHHYKRNTSEIYAGVLADVMLTPSLYCFYDFDHEELAIEAAIGYNVDLSEYSVSGLGVEFGAKLGYDHMGDKDYKKSFVHDEDGDSGYVYYGVNADLVYGFNNYTKAKFGLAYEGNSGDKDSWINQTNTKNMIWINASVDCAF